MLLSIVVRTTTETLWESSRMSLRSLVPVTTTCSIRSFHAAPEVSAASYSAVYIVESFSSACTDSASGTAAIAAAMHLKQYVIISSFCRFDEFMFNNIILKINILTEFNEFNSLNYSELPIKEQARGLRQGPQRGGGWGWRPLTRGCHEVTGD